MIYPQQQKLALEIYLECTIFLREKKCMILYIPLGLDDVSAQMVPAWYWFGSFCQLILLGVRCCSNTVEDGSEQAANGAHGVEKKCGAPTTPPLSFPVCWVLVRQNRWHCPGQRKKTG
ncbi:MAG: hypothetical protein CSA33_08330 [Desulfobulbus propionicus]|nr:MAG: hypothetical protein CSA33_08330 [Desulfobulbus propionicus]